MAPSYSFRYRPRKRRGQDENLNRTSPVCSPYVFCRPPKLSCISLAKMLLLGRQVCGSTNSRGRLPCWSAVTSSDCLHTEHTTLIMVSHLLSSKLLEVLFRGNKRPALSTDKSRALVRVHLNNGYGSTRHTMSPGFMVTSPGKQSPSETSATAACWRQSCEPARPAQR
jgi:hypothetical protein